jgi:hypothetical protein
MDIIKYKLCSLFQDSARILLILSDFHPRILLSEALYLPVHKSTPAVSHSWGSYVLQGFEALDGVLFAFPVQDDDDYFWI